MKDSVDIEIPLLNKDEAKNKYQSEENKSFHRKNENSHFINSFNPFSTPDKFIQSLPFLKWFTFLDILPNVRKINKSDDKLEHAEIPLPTKEFNVEAKVVELDYYWSKEQEKPEPAFYKALVYSFKYELLIGVVLNFIDYTTRLSYSIFMGKIIATITRGNFEEESEKQELLSAAITLCCLIVISYCCTNWAFFQSFRNGGKARLAITGLLYKKLHSISLTSLHEFKIGKVINLMANDLNDIDSGAIFLGTMILCPYLIILGTLILWGYFGITCLIGLVSSVLFLYGQIRLSNKTVEPRKENKLLTDDRIKYTNEIIENIRLIKMYAWEKAFKGNVEKLRNKEYNTFLRIVSIDALGRNLSIVSVYLSILMICTIYVSYDGILSPEKIYGSMIVLSFLSVTGLMFFHLGRMFVVNFTITLKRVEQILKIDDILTTNETQDKQRKINFKPEASFNNFTAYWNKEAQKPCLNNINLTLKPASLTTVIGKIGSGKTTLLLSFLKELPLTQGSLNLSGKVAYVEQEPIIFPGTFRENILFGKEYNNNLYKQVIRICNLDIDLETFSNGDQTLIGERGVNLSGGQKARLSLARAIYSESDIYLLDDPFSAVDSKVARDMFENGLKGDLLRDKIIVLVTHHLHFARESDYIVVMDEGRIEAQGTFSEIEKKNIDLLNIFNVSSRKSSVVSSDQSIEEGEEENKNKEIVEKEKEEKVTEEVTTVSWETYKKYFTTLESHKKNIIVIVILFITYQILTISFTRFIGLWSLEHSNFVRDFPDKNPSEFNSKYYMVVAWFLAIAIYLLSYFKRVRMSHFLLSTNSELHQKMLKTLMRAKVLFFDINPIGTVLNRFSNDIGTLDKLNLVTMFDLFDGILNSASLVLTVCIINPVIFLPAIIIIFLLYKAKQYFTKPNILTKKLEIASRSPIFSDVSSTLNGLIIIRVYNSGGRIIREFMDLLYNNSKAFLFMCKTNRLFAVSLDAGVKGMMIMGILIFTWVVFNYNIESALIGLSLFSLYKLEMKLVIRLDRHSQQILICKVHNVC